MMRVVKWFFIVLPLALIAFVAILAILVRWDWLDEKCQDLFDEISEAL